MKKNNKKIIITYNYLKILENKLYKLKNNKRKEIAYKINEAREQGDLSENAEYDAAKNEQCDIETKINKIEKILKNIKIITKEEINLKTINIGCKIKLLNIISNKIIKFKIVSSIESNSLNNKISNESPIGKILIGAKNGQVIKAKINSKFIKYKVLKIY